MTWSDGDVEPIVSLMHNRNKSMTQNPSFRHHREY
jgi:hypothetical protein